MSYTCRACGEQATLTACEHCGGQGRSQSAIAEIARLRAELATRDAVATIYCATLSDAKAHADGLARCILTATQKAKQANTQDLAAELAAAKQKLKFREAGWRAAYAQACGANSNFDALAKMAGHKLPTGLTRVDLRAVAGGPNQEFKCDT